MMMSIWRVRSAKKKRKRKERVMWRGKRKLYMVGNGKRRMRVRNG